MVLHYLSDLPYSTYVIKFERKDWNFRRIEEEIKCRFWSWGLAKGDAESSLSFAALNETRLKDRWGVL